MTRLDLAPLRKRSALRGETMVEVKAGDQLLGLSEAWALERYLALVQKEEKKAAPRKK